MLVSMQWLQEYIALGDVDLKSFESAMIMSGSNTEGVHAVMDGIEGVVVAKITHISPHENADKLVVCQCDLGGERRQIVTGAKNIAEGDYVALARDGATLAGDVIIRSGELRGVRSEGMLCSLQELGFNDKVIPKALADGLLIIEGQPALGQPIACALDFDDHVVEFEITSNRPDCLSMLGMAREVSATFDRPYKLPDTTIQDVRGDIAGQVSVTIEDDAKCARYACRMIDDVVIAPSPQWLQSKLIKAGMRPINNIVDITNYVLLEYGQPIHAFDYDCIADGKIIVRTALPGESIVTLDAKERQLSSEMLVIADPTGPLAIAGVMGGSTSEVSEKTTRLLIEVANFNKSSIRETSKQLGLRSEASSRYEKGISPELVDDALNRVCHLIERLKAGTVVGGVVDAYPRRQERPVVDVRVARMNGLIGTSLRADEMVQLLKRLECDVENAGDVLRVRPPYYRLDLVKEVDFSEEIARIYGYDKLEGTQHADHIMGQLSPRQQFDQDIVNRLVGYGLSEVVTYSFIGPSMMEALADSHYQPSDNVVIENPLGEEFSIMRPSLLPNILQVISRNLSRQIPAVSLFEVGNVFGATRPGDEPIETRKLAVAIADRNADFFALKGVLEGLFRQLHTTGVTYSPAFDHTTYHPGRCAELAIGDVHMGYIGQIHPKVQKSFALSQPVYVAEINLDILYSHYDATLVYQQLPKFPAATMDAAFVVDADINQQALVDIMFAHGGAHLRDVKLFDVYTGDQIAADKKSLAYTMTFRADDRTLVDEDIKASFMRVEQALADKLNAQLRSAE